MLSWEKDLAELEKVKYEVIRLGFGTSAQLDKALLSLSGGALVFSMTFIDKLAPRKLLLPVLVASWFFFGISLASVLLALRSAQLALSDQADKLDALSNLISSPEGMAATD